MPISSCGPSFLPALTSELTYSPPRVTGTKEKETNPPSEAPLLHLLTLSLKWTHGLRPTCGQILTVFSRLLRVAPLVQWYLFSFKGCLMCGPMRELFEEKTSYKSKERNRKCSSRHPSTATPTPHCERSQGQGEGLARAELGVLSWSFERGVH